MLGEQCESILFLVVVTLVVGGLSHGIPSARNLRAFEGPDGDHITLNITWTPCDFCDGYSLLFCTDRKNTELCTPFILKSTVSSLTIGGLQPRTKYNATLEALPNDMNPEGEDNKLLITGITKLKTAPPKVRQFRAEAYSSSELKVTWKSDIADGFILRWLEVNPNISEDDWREIDIAEFNQALELILPSLQHSQKYKVVITPYFKGLNAERFSGDPTSTEVMTLPEVLPKIKISQLNADSAEENFIVFWKNPEVVPLQHTFSCQSNGIIVVDISVDGSSSWLKVESGIVDFKKSYDCTLDSIYSSNPLMKSRSNNIIITKYDQEVKSSRILCRRDHYREEYFDSNRTVVGAVLTMPRFLHTQYISEVKVQLSVNQDTANLEAVQGNFQYKLCSDNDVCSEWTTKELVSGRNNFRSDLVFTREDLDVWKKYRLNTRLKITCRTNYYGGSTGFVYTKEEVHLFPPLIGEVKPVLNLTQTHGSASSSGVSWDESETGVNYYLIYLCRNRACEAFQTMQTFITFPRVTEGVLHYVSVTAVRISQTSAFLSSSRVISFFVPKTGISSGLVNISAEATDDNAKVLITLGSFNSSKQEPKLVEFHVEICAFPLNHEGPATCEKSFYSNSSLSFNRKPWTEYNVTATACFGAFDSSNQAKISLPLYKKKPSPLSGLSWDEDTLIVSWKYRSSSVISGFLVSICNTISDAEENCTNATTPAEERSFKAEADQVPGEELTVFVNAFKDFDSTRYDGPKSEIILSSTAR